jgi:hypothetical protein
MNEELLYLKNYYRLSDDIVEKLIPIFHVLGDYDLVDSMLIVLAEFYKMGLPDRNEETK